MKRKSKTLNTKDNYQNSVKGYLFDCIKTSLKNEVSSNSQETKIKLTNGNIVYVRIYEVKEN